MDSPAIEHTPSEHQYVLTLDGTTIGFAKYRDNGDQRVFTHTVVEPEFGGRGYATQLIDAAVADTLGADKRIVAECAMVKHWLTKHPEVADRVDAA